MGVGQFMGMYAFQLYQALHPEDVDATEADIGDVTIHNVFTDQEYNDLGMTVRGKVLVMLEAQASQAGALHDLHRKPEKSAKVAKAF